MRRFEQLKSSLQLRLETVKARLKPPVRSFSRLFNDLVVRDNKSSNAEQQQEQQEAQPEQQQGEQVENQQQQPQVQSRDWFQAYDWTRSCWNQSTGWNRWMPAVWVICIGLLVALVSLIGVFGDNASRSKGINSPTGGGGGGGGGGGSDGSPVGGGNNGSTALGQSYSNLGICYGRMGDNLPSPAGVATFLQSKGVELVKIYDSDPSVLGAFSKSKIKMIVGTLNADLEKLASSTRGARSWLKKFILPFPDAQITAISVGNEVLTANPELTVYLLRAMTNLHTSLVERGLDSKIKVSCTMATGVLANSYPPSAGSFRDPDVMKPILDFLAQTDSFFMLNVYPYFAYRADLNDISADYALFRPNKGIQDSGTGLRYLNLFDAQVDAVISAMESLGHKSDIPVVITETGWPSKGGSDEAGASISNAAAYNNNLITHITSGKGTPLRPGTAITVYIFALFNENSKPGQLSERNFGLFWPNLKQVYDVALTSGGDAGAGSGTDSGGGGGGGGAETGSNPPPPRNLIHVGRKVGRI